MKHVLIVEDEANIARIIQHNLQRVGLDTSIARDGEAALEEVHVRRPDAIILDLLLPKADGWTVAARLKADPATATIPILMLSIVADRERGLAAGASDYLTKPFTVSDLLDRVAKLLA